MARGIISNQVTGVTNAVQLVVKTRFQEAQAQESEERKLLATRFAINELALHRWKSSDNDYKAIYETVWLEKLMFVEMSYNVSQTLQIANDLKKGQQQLLVDVGLIVNQTGQILENTNVIIEQNGQILLIVEENLQVSYEILGNVKDIKATVDDMAQNGVHIREDYYTPKKKANNMMLILGVLLIGGFIYWRLKGKKGKKK